jgi:sugar phosphate isomerase/epimerase
MKLGIDTGYWRGLPIGEALRRLADAGWTDVQLSAGHVAPTDDLDALRATCERLGIVVRQVHCDEELGPKEEHLHANVRWLSVVRALGADCLITHANQDADYNTNDERRRCLELNRDCLRRLAARAGEQDLRVAVENRLERPWATCRRFGARMRDFLDLIDFPDSDHVGICLDTSHTRVSRLSFAEEIALAGSRLFATQISDCDGERQHRLPFTLEIDWAGLIGALKRVGYDGPLTIDAGPPEDASPEQSAEQLEVARRRLASLLA